MEAVERNGISKDTLIIYTTDNGTSPKADFSKLRKHGAELQNHWRGNKADAFEGGHRVPFIASWPGVIKPSTSSNQTISLVDIMATSAEAAGIKYADTAAEDSISLLSVMKDTSITKPLHEAVICHSISGQFVVRKGKWKIIYCPGSGGWSEPRDPVAAKQKLPKWHSTIWKPIPRRNLTSLTNTQKKSKGSPGFCADL